jgi:O-acetylhomoserine/O-acetylserine sulfhydrylase-like pyridoxal-dependent enzyme
MNANRLSGLLIRAVVDSGNFDWAASGKFPSFTEPSEGYHGLKYSETFGNLAFALKVRLDVLRVSRPAVYGSVAEWFRTWERLLHPRTPSFFFKVVSCFWPG